MDKRASDNKVIFINFLSNLLLNLISLLATPVISRLLGKGGYGLASIYAVWVSALIVLTGLSAHETLANACVDFSWQEARRYQSSVLSLSCLSTAGLLVIAILFGDRLSFLTQMPQWMLVLAVVHGFGAFLILFLHGKLTHELKPEKNLIASLAVSLSVAALSIVFILGFGPEKKYVGRILGTAIPNILLGAAILFIIVSHGRTLYDRAYWKYCLRISLPLVPSALFVAVLGQSDRLMLNWFISYEAVGLYTLTFNFTNILGTIWFALNQAWVPLYFRMEKAGDGSALRQHFARYIQLITVLTVGFLLLSREVFALYGGAEYSEGTNLIPIFVVTIYFQFLFNVALNYEFYMKKTIYTAILNIFLPTFNIVLNFVMIPRWSVQGAALATTTTYFCDAVGHWYVAKKVIGRERPFAIQISSLLPYIGGVSAAVVLFYLLPQSWWIRWGLGVLLGIWQLRYMFKNRAIF